jgi:DNA repair protein RadD
MVPELRPYQEETVEAARERLRQRKRSVLIICPTGGGKTVIASAIIRAAIDKRSRVLFLAHRKELITQARDKLASFDVRAGIIMPGHPRILQESCQVASIQTLIRNPGQLERVQLVFIDEAHHFTAENTYGRLLQWWPGARVVGLTATPWRMDGQGLGDAFDDYVISRTPRQLRDEGFLVPVGGWEYEAIDTSEARVQRGDYVAADLERAATSSRVVGDIVTEWLIHSGGARTVLFALNVEHSQHLVAAFRKEGVAAEHIDGEMPGPERDAVLARFRSGETRLVSNCNVLTEGWDCPEAEVAILARPTLSLVLYLQMVGRVLRPAPWAGKRAARIHDHAGLLAMHGHPYAERDYSPQVTARLSRQDAEEAARRVRRCPQCRSVVARWPCDGCGWSPNPQDLRLELMAEARRKEISNDPGEAPPAQVDETAKRRERWRRKYMHDAAARRALWDRFAAVHGTRKAKGVYRWFSGELEWPPREWTREAEGSAA